MSDMEGTGSRQNWIWWDAMKKLWGDKGLKMQEGERYAWNRVNWNRGQHAVNGRNQGV